MELLWLFRYGEVNSAIKEDCHWNNSLLLTISWEEKGIRDKQGHRKRTQRDGRQREQGEGSIPRAVIAVFTGRLNRLKDDGFESFQWVSRYRSFSSLSDACPRVIGLECQSPIEQPAGEGYGLSRLVCLRKAHSRWVSHSLNIKIS